MNLFILDVDPVLAARENCNSHVCKIILEAAQMLCLAKLEYGLPAVYNPKSQRNNPVSKWVRESLANYEWTVAHGLALCDEYSRRYGKMHAVRSIIEDCGLVKPPLNGGLTPFYHAVADDCKTSNVVETYRIYYNRYKAKFARWPVGETPVWFRDESDLAMYKNYKKPKKAKVSRLIDTAVALALEGV